MDQGLSTVREHRALQASGTAPARNFSHTTNSPHRCTARRKVEEWKWGGRGGRDSRSNGKGGVQVASPSVSFVGQTRWFLMPLSSPPWEDSSKEERERGCVMFEEWSKSLKEGFKSMGTMLLASCSRSSLRVPWRAEVSTAAKTPSWHPCLDFPRQPHLFRTFAKQPV